MKEIIYGPNEIIYNQNEYDDRVIIIVKGQIELTINKY